MQYTFNMLVVVIVILLGENVCQSIHQENELYHNVTRSCFCLNNSLALIHSITVNAFRKFENIAATLSTRQQC